MFNAACFAAPKVKNDFFTVLMMEIVSIITSASAAWTTDKLRLMLKNLINENKLLLLERIYDNENS